jgi:hypothetical protein
MEQALCQVEDSSKDSCICSLCTFSIIGKGLQLGHITVSVLTETAAIVLVCRAESPFCAHPDWASRGTGDGELYDLDSACQCPASIFAHAPATQQRIEAFSSLPVKKTGQGMQ